MSKHTPGALRAAQAICRAMGYDPISMADNLSEIIDRETGLPELLKAAKDAVDALIEEVQASGDYDHPVIKRHGEIADRLRDAIAKARGEES